MKESESVKEDEVFTAISLIMFIENTHSASCYPSLPSLFLKAERQVQIFEMPYTHHITHHKLTFCHANNTSVERLTRQVSHRTSLILIVHFSSQQLENLQGYLYWHSEHQVCQAVLLSEYV